MAYNLRLVIVSCIIVAHIDSKRSRVFVVFGLILISFVIISSCLTFRRCCWNV